MRTHSLITALIFICIAGCTPSTRPEEHLQSISITDRNGFSETISNTDRLEKYECVNFLSPQPYEKVLRVFHRDGEGNVHGELIAYHQNGQPEEYIQILNGRTHGCYRSWHSNGTPYIEATVLEGEPDFTDGAQQTWIFDGPVRIWDDYGFLSADIHYSKGLLEGESIYYHPSGNIWKVSCFHRGLETGKRQTFLDNGDLLSSIEYHEGVPHGKSFRYWAPNQLAAEETFENGLLQFGDYYNQTGSEVCCIRYGEGYRALFARDYIVEQRHYSGGEQEGEIQVLSPEGYLLQVYHVKNGLKHGLDTEYYAESRGTIPKISASWIEGELHGLVKTWYPNGNQESQREMNNTDKDGVLTAWYKNGLLMMIEEYEKNKLIKGEYYSPSDSRPVSRVVNGAGTATLYDADGNLTAKVKVENGKPVL